MGILISYTSFLHIYSVKVNISPCGWQPSGSCQVRILGTGGCRLHTQREPWWWPLMAQTARDEAGMEMEMGMRELKVCSTLRNTPEHLGTRLQAPPGKQLLSSWAPGLLGTQASTFLAPV